MLEPKEPPHMNISHNIKATWAREITQEAERYGYLEGSLRKGNEPNPFSSYVALTCDLVEK